MKIFFSFILLIIFLTPVMGQQESFRDADSLLKQLSKANSDTARILLKCRLGEAYRANNPDTSYLLATEALNRSRELNYKKGEAQALITLCVLYREKGDMPYALKLGLQALNISIAEELAYEEIFSYIRVGLVYMSVRDVPLARTYFRQAEAKLEKNYTDFQWSVTRYFIAEGYEQENKLDSAENIVLNLNKVKGFEPTWVVICNRLLGHIALKRNQYQQAIAYYRKSMDAAVEGNSIREAATATNAIAQVFHRIKQPDSAIVYAKQGLAWGEMLGYKTRVLAASSLLAEIYADKNPVEALKYYKMASAANDSIYGVQKVQQMQSATMKEQVRQRELEAEKLAYRNRIKQFAFLVGAAVFLFIALMLFRNNRAKQKANIKVEKAYNDLKTTQAQLIQSEKMASLGELTAGIAHEIQNPLNFVNNFSEVNKELIEEMNGQLAIGNWQDAKEIGNNIKENQEKISHHGKRADAIVKNMLLHSGTGTGKKESVDLNALADEYLRLAFHGLRARDNSFNAKLDTNFEQGLQKVEVIPQDIGRVLLNLINNALFAVDEKRKSGVANYDPTVIVSSKLNGKKVLITVKDNGAGIPDKIKEKIFQPFFTTKATGQGTGLGLSLSYDIIKSHGGEISVNSREGEGSEFIISLPG